MQGPFKFWKVLDKRRLLLTLMEELAGGAHVSFEGRLRGLSLSNISGASGEPTSVLKRNTLSPKQDFVVVPLEPSMGQRIIAAIGGHLNYATYHEAYLTSRQIEKDGQLQFGAYDNVAWGRICPQTLWAPQLRYISRSLPSLRDSENFRRRWKSI